MPSSTVNALSLTSLRSPKILASVNKVTELSLPPDTATAICFPRPMSSWDLISRLIRLSTYSVKCSGHRLFPL